MAAYFGSDPFAETSALYQIDNIAVALRLAPTPMPSINTAQ
jgi:hypothetical protein